MIVTPRAPLPAFVVVWLLVGGCDGHVGESSSDSSSGGGATTVASGMEGSGEVGPTVSGTSEPEGTTTLDTSPSTRTSGSTSADSETTTAEGSTTTGVNEPNYACVPEEPLDCTPTTHCVAYDPQGLEHWSGLTCRETVSPQRVAGDPCSMPGGPLQDQGDCGFGLLCAGASLSATTGVCAKFTALTLECETVCIGSFRVCLEELGCPDAGDFCKLAGCDQGE